MEIRQIKYAASEEVKLQKSPFIQIKKELIMTPFVPPKSPHHLIEEELYDDPWALLVATIFLNKTCAKAARPYVFWFLDDNPDPLTVVGKKVEQLETYFGALGLQKTRSVQVRYEILSSNLCQNDDCFLFNGKTALPSNYFF